jgi:hypothetical protein
MKRQPTPPPPEGLSEAEWKRVLEARKADARRGKARAQRKAKEETEQKEWRTRRGQSSSRQPDVDAVAERARHEQERVARLYQEEMARKQEREAQRDLALRIIDIGYKALAKELHPDKGGSRDMMSRLNRARDHLKTMALMN